MRARRKSRSRWSSWFVAAALGVLPGAAERAPGKELPVLFEENVGQTSAEVRFLARMGSATLYLTDTDIVIAAPGAALGGVGDDPVGRVVPRGPRRVIRLRHPAAASAGLEPAATRVTCFLAKRTLRGVPVFRAVALRDGAGGELRIEALSSRQIRLRMTGGAAAPPLDLQVVEGELAIEGGGVRIHRDGFEVRLHASPAAADAGTRTVRIGASGFAGAVLVFGTYVGGSGGDFLTGLARDDRGGIYFAGYTDSLDYPVVGGVQGTNQGGLEVFVTKLSPALDAILFSTYVGGSDGDLPGHLEVDSTGVYVVGTTYSEDFPVWNALKPVCGCRAADGFFFKLDLAGGAFAFSSFLGGMEDDQAAGIALDPSGAFYVVGYTASGDFPLRNPLFTTIPGGFITKISARGDAILYSTAWPAVPKGVAMDAARRVYVAGDTWLDGYPVVNPIQATRAGKSDTFVSELAADGSGLLFSTYYGGTDVESRARIAVDPTGAMSIVGETQSTDLPVQGALQGTNAGNGDVFVAHIAPSGSLLDFATYLGGSGWDIVGPPTLDRDGRIYVSGTTASADFPTFMPLMPRSPGWEAFISVLDPRVPRLCFSTYFGGTRDDAAGFLAVDDSGGLYVGGGTTSTDIPAPHSILPYAGGLDGDAFVAKIALPTVDPEDVVTGPGPAASAAPRVRAYDLGGNALATDIIAYGVLQYGVNVGTGSVDTTGGGEILTGPGPGSVFGPHVRGFEPTSAPIARISFYAYGTLRFGASAMGAAVDVDTFDEIVTAPGPGAVFGPHARGWNFDGNAIAAIPGLSFYAYQTLRYGLDLGSGSLSASGNDELLTAPGPGPTFGPHLRAFRYGPPVVALAKVSFFAFATGRMGGRADGSDVDGDTWDEILAGPGPGAAFLAQVRGFDYDGLTVSPIATLDFIGLPSAYGSEPRGGDLDGDGHGELMVAAGPDPAAVGRARGYDYESGNILPIPFLDVAPYTTAYGLHVAASDLGL